jgi:hypothetical protein
MEKALAVLAIFCLLFVSCASGPNQKGAKKDNAKKNTSVSKNNSAKNNSDTGNENGNSRNYRFDDEVAYSDDESMYVSTQKSDSTGKTRSKPFKFAPTAEQVVEVSAGVTLTAPYLIFLIRKLLFRR